MNENTTDNSANRLLALGIALTIGVWLVIMFTGKQTEENPITATPQPEAKEKAKAIGGFDAAEEFRERHNRALSPEAREDHRRKLWEQNFPFKPTYDPAVTVTADMISDEPESLTARRNHFDLKASCGFRRSSSNSTASWKNTTAPRTPLLWLGLLKLCESITRPVERTRTKLC